MMKFICILRSQRFLNDFSRELYFKRIMILVVGILLNLLIHKSSNNSLKQLIII